VVADDALQHGCQPELAARADEAVVELLEALDERALALGEALQLAETPTSGEASTTSSAWSSKRLRSSAR
jgi:hypothetical protein